MLDFMGQYFVTTLSNLNLKTVLKSRKSSSINDQASGPINPKSVLTEQQIISEFTRVSALL